MITYFGFIPDEQLSNKIDETIQIVESSPQESLYPIQLSITQDYTDQILKHLVLDLVEKIDYIEGNEKMQKVGNTIRSTINLMNKQVIVEQTNDKIADSLIFLLKDSVFIDNRGKKRIGFALTTEEASKITENFKLAKKSEQANLYVQIALTVIIKANINHFIKQFGESLHLNPVRNKIVSMSESAINKTSKIIVNKYLANTPHDICMHIVDNFEPSIIRVNTLRRH